MHRIDTVVIGAGQAGLALSWHLMAQGVAHVVLERARVGERWRSERWDSLSLLTPNWLNRLPGSPPHPQRNGFLAGRAFADYVECYAAWFSAPVHEHTEVREVRRSSGGYRVHTSRGDWWARRVVIATGDSALAALPAVARSAPSALRSLHASAYRRPSALPPGAVLVVGAGPSGQQIAAELRRAGRQVVLAAGGHARVPRTYRGRDIFEWLALSGSFDETLDDVADPARARSARSLPLSGARGGERLDLGTLGELGVIVGGRLTGFSGGAALLADDLEESVARAETRLAGLLSRFDELITCGGLPARPPDPPPSIILAGAPRQVDLREVGSIVWATGYRRAYPWLRVPVLDRRGEIVQRRGVTAAAGLHTLGMRFQWRRKSHYIGGVGSDAADLAALLAAS